MRNLFFLLLALAVFFGCKNDSSVREEARAEMQQEYQYPISPAGKSVAYNDAKLEDFTYQNGTFTFQYESNKYKLGEQTPDAAQRMCANSGKGQHIHLIVDKEPYNAIYETSFEKQMADGSYNILAFLSRSYHESIKNGDAAVAKRVTVSNGSITETDEIYEPTMFYSRPKGTYVGEDTKKILLDFYPINAEVGSEFLVKVQINGEVHYLDSWEPYFIEGLPYGDSSIGVALVNKRDSSIVEGIQTSMLNRITLLQDPVESD